MRLRRIVGAAAVTVVLVQCAPPPAPPAPTPATPAPSPTTQVPQPPTVRAVTAEELGATWRPECPVRPEQLRRVELDHWGFDGRLHRGELVVDADITDAVIEVFAQLTALRFPIEKMRSANHYRGAEDELSMRDNNTSAFNCRGIPGSTSWSWHAYGRAVDINPRINPYVDSRGHIEPANGAPWLDRTRRDTGMLHDGDPAVEAFVDRGWRWGGHWHTPLDYQHFELRA
ncbi:MAG: M15 family metallopeptidase [Actinomycetota bacterium]